MKRRFDLRSAALWLALLGGLLPGLPAAFAENQAIDFQKILAPPPAARAVPVRKLSRGQIISRWRNHAAREQAAAATAPRSDSDQKAAAAREAGDVLRAPPPIAAEPAAPGREGGGVYVPRGFKPANPDLIQDPNASRALQDVLRYSQHSGESGSGIYLGGCGVDCDRLSAKPQSERSVQDVLEWAKRGGPPPDSLRGRLGQSSDEKAADSTPRLELPRAEPRSFEGGGRFVGVVMVLSFILDAIIQKNYAMLFLILAGIVVLIVIVVKTRHSARATRP